MVSVYVCALLERLCADVCQVPMNAADGHAGVHVC